MAIYGSSHPEIAETLYRQAQVLLRMAESGEGGDKKTEAGQKLEEALDMLRQSSAPDLELITAVGRAIAEL
jgi:hypothetical protein